MKTTMNFAALSALLFALAFGPVLAQNPSKSADTSSKPVLQNPKGSKRAVQPGHKAGRKNNAGKTVKITTPKTSVAGKKNKTNQVGDDQQMMNEDLQEKQQKISQAVETISDIQKKQNDSAQSMIGNIKN